MKIKVFGTTSNKLTSVEVTGTTWGQVYDQLVKKNLINSNMRAVLRENRMTLESRDIVMPTESYIIFVSPTKTKSGYNPNEDNNAREVVEELFDGVVALFEEALEKLDEPQRAEIAQLEAEARKLFSTIK